MGSKLDENFLFDSFDNGKAIKVVKEKRLFKKPKIKTERVNLVIEPSALALIRVVAIKSGTSISSFMVVAATEAAKQYRAKHSQDFN